MPALHAFTSYIRGSTWHRAGKLTSWLVAVIALAGCLDSQLNYCPGGGVCPKGLRCGMAGTTQVCVAMTCGNGRLDSLESCDDGNNVSGDGCPADCTAPCGDGIRDPGEACDDGNTVGGDGCAADCSSNEACGNGLLDPGEVCDDGGLLSHDGCSSRCTIEAPAWTALEDAPSVRSDHVMVYDAVRGNVVLFGGTTAQGPSSETWTWDGSIWRRRTPTTIPPARGGQAMAYDAARQRIVMVGGNDLASDGTWQWDGSDWSEQIQHNPFPPPPLVGAAMAYDAARQRIVLFGGTTPNGVEQGKTWQWDGTTWSELTTKASPPARAGHAMAYDAKRGVIVLFAGITGASRLGDTWELDGATWRKRSASGPPGNRAHPAMTFDATRGKVVLLGGDGDPGLLGDTWEWDGTQWTAPPTPAVPTARSAAGMAFDAARGKLVLFGGQQGTGAAGLSNDTWEWDTTIWTRRAIRTELPPLQSPTALFYDAARSRLVLVGVFTPSPFSTFEIMQVWEWDGANWLPRVTGTPPVARSGFGISSDGTTALLFGGLPQISPELNDTWVLSGSQWIRQTPATPPPGRQNYAIAFDEGRGKTVLFGGLLDTVHFLSDTWQWDGSNWTQPIPAHVPVARHDAAMAYDRKLGQLVMFGGGINGPIELGEPTDVAVDETWAWNGNDWIALSPAARPPARECAGMTYDPVRGRMVLFGGQSSVFQAPISLLSDTWEWDGSNWQQRTPTTSPPGGCGAQMAFDPRRGHVVRFDRGDLWEWDGTEWSKTMPDRTPPARTHAAIAYDPGETTITMFGGEVLPGFGTVRMSDIWVWNGVQWRERSSGRTPAGRSDHAVAFDLDRRRFVMFGGAEFDRTQTHPDGLHRFDDTWEWDGSDWSERIPAHRPAARQGHAMVYDAARRRVLMFGGTADGGSLLSEQWTWDGRDWTRMAPTVVPPARADFGLAYDAGRDKVVLFGGDGGSAFLNDVWEWNGTTWSEQHPSGAVPPARVGASLLYDARRRHVVLIGGNASSDRFGSDPSLGDVWEWDGAAWTQVTVTGPAARNHQVATYDAARATIVMFGGNTGAPFGGNESDTSTLGDTWLLHYADPATPDEACATGFDADGDRQIGCADLDCAGICTTCGDGVCSALESCRLCPDDCGACQACGDLHCDPGEDCASCPGDCGACPGAP